MERSIRAQLTLWNSVAMVLVLTAFSVGIVWLQARWSRGQFDADLADLGAAAFRMMQEEIAESDVLTKAAAEAGSSMDVPGRAMAILDANGAALAAQWHGFRYDPLAVPADPLGHQRFMTLRQSGEEWRVFTRHEAAPDGEYVIFVAGSLAPIEGQLSLLTRVLLVATPLIGLAAAGLSWWAATFVLGPVTTMASEAEAITARSSDRRLRAPTVGRELGQLARAFNRLLDRLDAGLRRQRQFMADASHELRTPVSVIQTAAEVTLDRPGRNEAEYRDAMSIVSEQAVRLGRMVEDMLVLARADAGGYPLKRRPLYVDEVLTECVRAAAVVGARKSIQVSADIQSDVQVSADDDLLRRLVMNLLDNAVLYTPAGGAVTVTLTKRAGVATISVADTGPGIPDADRERVFDRFVRLDPSRSETPGAGLGLSIARWIAEQHEGTLTLDRSGSGGCVFTASLPLTPSRGSEARTLTSSQER